MLMYSDARYEHVNGTEDEMHSDFAHFVREHLREPNDMLIKSETTIGNEQHEVFRCDCMNGEDRAEFRIITRHFYGYYELSWTNSGTNIMKHTKVGAKA